MARIGMAPLAVLAAMGLAGCRSPGEHQESGVKESRIEGKTRLPQPTLNPGDVRDAGTGTQITISADTFTPRKPEPPQVPAGSTTGPGTSAGGANTTVTGGTRTAAADSGMKKPATDAGRTKTATDTGRTKPAADSAGTRAGQAGGTSRPST